MSKLGLSADEVLTTTRSVRKRLDFDRPVSRELITECIGIAHQSPSGSNSMRWRWLIIDDQERKDFLAALYRERFYAYAVESGKPTSEQAGSAVQESGAYLADNMARVPVLVIPLLADRMTESTPVSRQASRWGSILPGVWSFMLALRERGLGSCWTTLHLADEKLVAGRLNIPYDQFTQAGLFPVAYTIGTDFKLAKRPPAETFIRWNEWS
ncbi:MAG: nitroreductase family protein [Actinobacteria bacterium]|nr:nitroreductase family protein [Actinomycetota bacterium]